MSTALWAIVGSNLPVKLLAAVGAAVVGGFLFGWLVQLAAMAFGQKVPRVPLWGVRTLAGLTVGWLAVKLWLFAGGGGGLGGPGGLGVGSGEAPGHAPPTVADKKKEKMEGDTSTGEGDILRIEVLGDAPLQKIARATNFDAARRYRILGERELRTLDEVQELIRQRRAALARLEIVVYRDSPARDRPQVAELAAWARDLDHGGKGRLKVDFSEQDRYAPVQ